jgi:hypothetical protein
MRRYAFVVILAFLGAACTEDESSTVSYVVNEPDPPVPIYELSVMLVGRTSSAQVTSGTEPLEFPQRGGGWGVYSESDVVVQLCAGARGAGEEDVLVALGEPVTLIRGRNVEVPLSLEPVEDGEVPAACEDGALDGGALALAP